MDGKLVDAFADASRYLTQVAGEIPEEAWSRPGLGDWSVLELVAHANRGQTTVVDYLESPQPPAGPEYFTAEAIAARGRDAVVVLGTDPVAALRSASATAVELVERTTEDATVGSPSGTMTLLQFLPSRIAELTIHAVDICCAIEVDAAPPSNALIESVAFVASRGAMRDGMSLLLALTGRGALPPGYSVYS